MFGKTEDNFFCLMNPQIQNRLYKEQDRCYFGNCPTLSELNAVYNNDYIAQAWLIPQLTDLSEFCGVKEKINSFQCSQCAEIIANDFFYLKASEVMLFFAKFKRGEYGRFFGAIDPLFIINSLRLFCQERILIYEKKENEERLKENNEQKKYTCTWEEFASMLALNKDGAEKNIDFKPSLDDIKKAAKNIKKYNGPFKEFYIKEFEKRYKKNPNEYE